MPNYKIEKPEGAPDWFTPGIVCLVRRSPIAPWGGPYPLAWYRGGRINPFLDSVGYSWAEAKPVERWVPEDGEIVLEDRTQWGKDYLPLMILGVQKDSAYAVYRFTDEVHEAIKAGTLTVGWLREHGEKYEPNS